MMQTIWILLCVMMFAAKFPSVCGGNFGKSDSLSAYRKSHPEGYMVEEYFGDPFHNDSYVQGKTFMEDLNSLPAITFTMAELMLLAAVQDVPLVTDYPGQYKILKETELSAAVYTVSGFIVSALETSTYRFEELVTHVKAIEFDLRFVTRAINETDLETANSTMRKLELNIAKGASLAHNIDQGLNYANDYIFDFVMAATGAIGNFRIKQRHAEKELDETKSQQNLLTTLSVEIRQAVAVVNDNQSIGEETFCRLQNSTSSAMGNNETDADSSLVSNCGITGNLSTETDEQLLLKTKELLERTVRKHADNDAKILRLSYEVNHYAKTVETLRKCFNPLANTQLILARLLGVCDWIEVIMTSDMTDQIVHLRRSLFEPIYKCIDNRFLINRLQSVDILAKFSGMIASTFVDIQDSYLKNSTRVIEKYAGTTDANVDQRISQLRNERAAAQKEVAAIGKSKFEITKGKLSELA